MYNTSQTYHMINVTMPIRLSRALTYSYRGDLTLDRYDGKSNRNQSIDTVFAAEMDFNGVVGMIRYDDTFESNIRAYTWGIYPCMQSFSAAVENGELREKLAYEDHDAFDLSRPNTLDNLHLAYSTADLECLDEAQRQQLNDLGYKWSEMARFVPYQVSIVNGTLDNPEYLVNLSAREGFPCELSSLSDTSWNTLVHNSLSAPLHGSIVSKFVLTEIPY